MTFARSIVNPKGLPSTFPSPFSIPFSGNYRYYSGAVINVGGEGDFWASTSASAPNAHRLNFNSNNLNPQNNNYKGYGFSVRCVAQ